MIAVQLDMRERSSVHEPESGGGPAEKFGLGGADADSTLPAMSSPADARRRWLGLFCLAMAAGMVTWGIIVLGPRLQGLWFLGYWAVCFLFTFAAIVIAFLDAHAVRRRLREEQEKLLRQTLGEIDSASKRRGPRPAPRATTEEDSSPPS